MLTGQWPSGRRYVNEAQLHPGLELGGDELAYSRMMRKLSSTPGVPGADGEDGEFTVKLLKVRICWRNNSFCLRGYRHSGRGKTLRHLTCRAGPIFIKHLCIKLTPDGLKFVEFLKTFLKGCDYFVNFGVEENFILLCWVRNVEKVNYCKIIKTVIGVKLP